MESVLMPEPVYQNMNARAGRNSGTDRGTCDAHNQARRLKGSLTDDGLYRIQLYRGAA
jgi:hypothetical protein